MPVSSIEGLPAKARETFESVMDALKGKRNPRTGKTYSDEERGMISWAAVKRKFHKGADGKWVANQSKALSSANDFSSSVSNKRLLSVSLSLLDFEQCKLGVGSKRVSSTIVLDDPSFVFSESLSDESDTIIRGIALQEGVYKGLFYPLSALASIAESLVEAVTVRALEGCESDCW